MSSRQRVSLLAVLGVVAMVVCGALGYAQGTAKPAPTIVSGADVGFRMEDRDGNRAVGTLMVRINGQWFEARFGKPGKLDLTTK